MCVKAEADRPADRALHVQGRSQCATCRSIVAELPVLSKAYYAKHPFDQISLEKPLGSGPYEIGDFKPGTYVTYKRRPDYWAKDLPVNRGRFNFDELRYEYYRDRTRRAAKACKSGAFDFREEFTSIDWATGYDIPAGEGRPARAR